MFLKIKYFDYQSIIPQQSLVNRKKAKTSQYFCFPPLTLPELMTVPSPDMHSSRVSAENMRADLELSLKTLRTDYIDLYFYLAFFITLRFWLQFNRKKLARR